MPRRPGEPSATQLDPTPLPTVLHARDYPRAHLLALERTGAIQSVRRGTYLASRQLDGLSPYAAQRVSALARITAVAERLASAVVSHESAAALWGLPLVTAGTRVHVLQRSRPSARRAKDIARHITRVPPDQITVHRGLPVTTLERTVVDCAMTLRTEPGLILADAALHAGADLDLCREILASLGPRSGSVRARTVLEYADGGAESPGETRARLLFLRAGFPRPVTQVPITLPSVTFWSDLGWLDQRVLAEYDGVAKYSAQGSAAAAVLEEKRREELIVAEGYRVVRIDRTDLRDDALLATRLRQWGNFGTLIRRPELNG